MTQNRAWHRFALTFLTGLIGLGLLLTCFSSCKKTKPAAPIPITPLQTLVNNDTTLSLYHRLILEADNTGVLADDSITLLIPTNAAFRAAGYTPVIIDSMGSSIANRLLLYHLITSRAIPDSGGYSPYATGSGFTVYGRKDSSAVFRWNSVTSAGNGTPVGKALVYRMNGLLNSPADSLLTLLGSDSTLTICAELFLRTKLDSILTDGGGSFTVLAPTNTAFIAAGYDSVGAIDSADPNTMVLLANEHVLTNMYFTDILAGLNSATTLAGSTLGIQLSNGTLQFTSSTIPGPANLIDGNRTAGNTIVVHRIDKLLGP